MASNNQMLAVAAAIAVLFLPALASAVVHPVGDGSGWTLGFDYTAWSESKQFRVGDALGNKSNSHGSIKIIRKLQICFTQHFLKRNRDQLVTIRNSN
jgi:opacity protein-like surface antigen